MCNIENLINSKIIYADNGVQCEANLIAKHESGKYYLITVANSRRFIITEISESEANKMKNLKK